MAFFPRSLYESDVSFAPLFRLLDDFDNYSRQGMSGRRPSMPTWQPKFDIRETGEAYELHGELPGISKENVHIEFTGPQTMLIRGKTERTYTAGTPPCSPSPHDTGTEATEKEKPKAKFWLSERSVGEFSRSFNFPTPVDQASVTASFKDGILNIVAPKAKKQESRRIAIS
ncbi:hypothetical protein FSOLCH5_014506 [Fusarium solani]